MTVKLSVSLTDSQAEYARKLVEEGRYSSTSAVIQQALEAKRREDEEFEAWKTGLEKTLTERMDAPTISYEEFQNRVEKMLEEESARLDLES